jgi:hypothetical protein
MGLFSIYADTDTYRAIHFDRDQSRDIFGDDPRKQFDVNFEPKAYTGIWKKMNISFSDDGSGLHGDIMPDISENNGRLFLSQIAYDALKDLLKNDGEFLPVTYEHGDAFMFNPLSLAESVDGLDTSLSVKDEWGDIENTAFHEEKVKNFMIFRSEFDHHRTAHCQETLKKAVEEANLQGVFFTPDLGQRFSIKFAKKLRNS